jgi:hypothetical protein
MHPFHAKLALVTAAVAALLAPLSSAPAAAAASAAPALHMAGAPSVRRDLPEPPPADVVRKELGELTVAAPHPMTGYSRSKFPHWITQYGTCDTREVVLARDGQDVIRDEQCRAASGTWYSAYDGKVSTRPSTEVDIDHVVPLANGWRSGADEWTTAKRRQFANDLTNPQLIAVSASSNRQKGDQSPDQWAPPLHSYWCTYARAWTHVKYVYELNITAPEKSTLDEMLDTCPA